MEIYTLSYHQVTKVIIAGTDLYNNIRHACPGPITLKGVYKTQYAQLNNLYDIYKVF